MTHGTIRRCITVLFACAPLCAVQAELVRLPPVPVRYVFPDHAAFLPSAETWIDYRQYFDRKETEDFGTDFELGGAYALFGSNRVALQFMPRMLYQAAQYRETNNPFAFSSRHLTVDLRITAAYRFDGFVLFGGGRHDCTHLIDESGGRRPIHDAFIGGVAFTPPPIPLADWGKSVDSRLYLEGEYNIPTIFWGDASYTDQGRITVGGNAEIPTPRIGGFFLNGYSSLIFRDTTRSNVDGISRVNLDWAVAGGYRFYGEAGTWSLYYRAERLTDAWIERDVNPVLVHAIGTTIHM